MFEISFNHKYLAVPSRSSCVFCLSLFMILFVVPLRLNCHEYGHYRSVTVTYLSLVSVAVVSGVSTCYVLCLCKRCQPLRLVSQLLQAMSPVNTTSSCQDAVASENISKNRNMQILPRKCLILSRKCLILPRKCLILPRKCQILPRKCQILPRKCQ